jgi:uncharacterized protein YkwD
MICRRPILLATLTLLLIFPLASSSTAAMGSAEAGAARVSKRPTRTTGRARKAKRTHGVTRRRSGAGERDRSRPKTPARHRTRGFRRTRPGASTMPAKARTAPVGRPAAIAAVLATSCQNTELIPTQSNLELIRAAVLCLIDRERAQNGEPPLALSPQLQQAAQGHSQELVSADYFDHVSPSGVTPVDRIRATGYIPSENVGYVIGENLAWGTLNLATPQSVVNAWIASPGHLANILEAQYTDTGVGVTPAVPPSLSGGEPGATYAQEFGVIVH